MRKQNKPRKLKKCKILLYLINCFNVQNAHWKLTFILYTSLLYYYKRLILNEFLFLSSINWQCRKTEIKQFADLTFVVKTNSTENLFSRHIEKKKRKEKTIQENYKRLSLVTKPSLWTSQFIAHDIGQIKASIQRLNDPLFINFFKIFFLLFSFRPFRLSLSLSLSLPLPLSPLSLRHSLFIFFLRFENCS